MPFRPDPFVAPRLNGQRQTMVVVDGPVEFAMGSPAREEGRTGGADGPNEQQHWKRIGRSYALSAHPVTVAQFLQFRSDHPFGKIYSPSPTCPINSVTWYDAAAYCNWLSAQEGLPRSEWCYDPDQEFEAGMVLFPDYLERLGYRLPTEAEWECACRAKSVTSRYFAETEELLAEYAWYTKNSQDRCMLAVGTLKPNDLGLFDMLGNAVEWCQDRALLYRSGSGGAASEDVEDPSPVQDSESRVLRGGSFIGWAALARSANRNGGLPGGRLSAIGFRVARTYP